MAAGLRIAFFSSLTQRAGAVPALLMCSRQLHRNVLIVLYAAACSKSMCPLGVQATETTEQYQLQKMRCLRDINVDSNTVGWYQSAPYNEFQTVQIIETFISYEESVKKCVCIICDVKDSQRGSLALKAVALNKKFMDLYKKNPNVRCCRQCPARLVYSCADV